MGGAGGHMWHPFDCPDVNSGQDLIDFYRKSIEWMKTNKASLKIDGVNLSFRVIENSSMPTGYEFAIDRGSQQEVDRVGVTNANAKQKFKAKPFEPEKNEEGEFECPEGAEVIYVGEEKQMMCYEEHGMIAATEILTAIFNDALPDIMPELQQLGMLDNIGPYSNYFNTEFVLKQINVKEYAFDFIAIHGINDFQPNRYDDEHKLAGQIRWKKNKDIQVDGVGDTDPDAHKEGDPVPGHLGYLWRWDELTGWAASFPGSRVGKSIDYDQAVLDKLKDKVASHAAKREFRIYTKIPTDTVEDINLEKALNKEFTIVYSSQMRDPSEPGEMGIGEGSTKPIEAWLADVTENPLKKGVIISDYMREKYSLKNEKQFAMAKNIYLEVLEGTPINKIVTSPEFIEPVVDGAVVWHATRHLGNAVLDSQESDFGRARVDGKNKEEGVVIKDPNICGGTEFKFTGDFIVGGLASTFEEQKFRKGRLLESFIAEAEPVIKQKQQTVILLPGGFKPPTGGHYGMIKHYEQQSDIEKIYVITGHKQRDGISYEQSQAIFKIYGGFSDKVEFLEAPEGTRGAMDTCFKMLEINPEEGIDRPVLYPEIVERHRGSVFSLGAGDKGADPKRIAAFANYFIDNPERSYLDVKTTIYEAAPSCEVDSCPASASRMRKAFKEGDWELFKKLLPDDNFYDDVVQVLNGQSKEIDPGGEEGDFFTENRQYSLDNGEINEQSNLDADQIASNKIEKALSSLDMVWRNLFMSLGLPAEEIKELKPQLVATISSTLQDAIKKDLENKSKALEDEPLATNKMPVEEVSVVSSISGYAVKNDDQHEESIIRR